MNTATFFHMGGYAIYVWTAYALAAGVLTFNVVYTRYQRRQITKRLYKQQQREQVTNA